MANNSKKKLIQEITDWLKAELEKDPLDVNSALLATRKISPGTIFHHDDSLRLRSFGFQLLKIYFDFEDFKIDKDPLTAGDLLALARVMNAPYYINKSKIYLFHHEHIVMCKMSGSVALWLQNLS